MGPDDYKKLTRAGTRKIEKSKRGYESAKVSRIYSLNTIPKPADVDIRNGLRALVSRARHEAQNNDYMKQYLRECKTNIVGAQGMVLQARTRDANGKQDKLANIAIEDAWQDWSRYGTPEITGNFSLKMLDRLYVETMFRDGECLLMKHYGYRGNPYRYTLQMLDPMVLDVMYNRDLRDGNVIRMGVELNTLRQPVAYHLLTTNPSGEDYYRYGNKQYIRYPAKQIIHRFMPEWVWQTRGVPAAAVSLLRMNMLTGYEDAELVAARTAASKMGFWVTPDGEPPPGSAYRDTEGTEPSSASDFTMEAEPGHFDVVPEGYDLRSWDPQHPNAAFKDFMKAMLRGIASGLGVNYNTLANDLEGVNYNSLRHGAIVERAMWMLAQDWIVESFKEVVYNDWLGMSLLAGQIKVNGNPLRADRIDKYRRVTFQPRRWPWVDPLKEMKANETAIDKRIRSISEIIREQGRDPDDVFDEIARERERLAELKIPLTEAAPAAFSNSGGQKDADDD